MNEALELAARLELGASIARDRRVDRDFSVIADATAAMLRSQHAEIEGWKNNQKENLRNQCGLHAEIERLKTAHFKDAHYLAAIDENRRLHTEIETLKSQTGVMHAVGLNGNLTAKRIECDALRAVNINMTQAIMDAYGILWCINTEPLAPIPMLDPERAAAKARLILKEMLCHEQMGIAINTARAALGDV